MKKSFTTLATGKAGPGSQVIPFRPPRPRRRRPLAAAGAKNLKNKTHSLANKTTHSKFSQNQLHFLLQYLKKK
jgi:hypothetical protein